MPTLPRVAIPAGFREDVGHGSGLIVPESLSRQREVITQDEWRQLTRTIKDICMPHNMRVVFFCNDQKCAADPRMERIRTAHGFILRCRHRDLVFQPDPAKPKKARR